MVKVVPNAGWRKEWQDDHKRPENDTQRAEEAMLDPSNSPAARKTAALRGVPTPVAGEQRFSMWIPAAELTATFDAATILCALGSEKQSQLWQKCAKSNNVTDFRSVRGAGIRFTCNAATVHDSLGNHALTICGQKFKIQPYPSTRVGIMSIGLINLPEGVTDSDIYDRFESQGDIPVFVAPTIVVNGIASSDRRVVFNQQQPPKSTVLADNKPLRQQKFAQGYSVMTHRFSSYNRTLPPFLEEQRKERW